MSMVRFVNTFTLKRITMNINRDEIYNNERRVKHA